MAVITANVTKVSTLTIKTNKGDLILPLSYINISYNDVAIDDYISITRTTTDEYWYPYNGPFSVVGVHSTPFRATEFTANKGMMQGTIVSDNNYKLDIDYVIDGTKHTESYTYNVSSDSFLIPNYFVIIDSNNTPALLSKFLVNTSSNFDVSTYTPPSNYGFGSITRDAFFGAGSVLFEQKSIPLGKTILGISTYIPPDPFNQGGITSSGGGGGTFGGGNTIFGGNSDSIDVPPLPTASASSAGFITLFNPTLGQLNNLANYMWSDLFSLDTFKKIFADPMDCILGLSIVPVKPASAGTSIVKIGNISTDVSMNKTSSQYVTVDCGTIDVKEYWGAYLDYAPYTQCEIYLPYVGTKQISVDDVMNKSVHVVYHVDILSGACNAYVKCGDSVLYTFVGQCSSSIPISGNDWTNVLNGAISVAGKIGLAMATGGATALMSGLGAASSIISSSKPTVERSGAMSSTGGLLGIQKPYLILTRPKQALPENQNKYTGYPSFITMALSDCTGYTEIDSVHLENMSCTDEEAQEIENLLKSGVIF